jgi:hypothetical protein
MAFYQHPYESPSMFENRHFPGMSAYHHVEPSTLMGYPLETSDWVVKEQHIEDNHPTTWDIYDSQFHQEMYSSEDRGEYHSPPADLSPISDGDSDTAWSEGTSKSGSILPTPVKEEPTNQLDFISTPLTASTERTPSPDQTTSAVTTAPTKPTASKKRDSTGSAGLRKSSSTDSNDATAMKRKKAAHNAIEKRYRTNMNAKFVALGKAIPNFRQRQGLNGSGKSSSKKSLAVKDGAAASGTQPLPQNKSEVLTNALAYITELQEQNRLLQNEVAVLRGNLMGHNQPMWHPVGMP